MATAAENPDDSTHLFAAFYEKIPGHVDSVCFCAIEHVLFCWSVLYHDAETGKYFIEVTSGARKFHTVLQKPTGFGEEYKWTKMVSVKQAGRTFLCAIAEERAANRIAAVNFLVKIPDSQLIIADQKLINFSTIAADCELLAVQRNSKKPSIDCILVSSKSTSSPQYHRRELTLDNSGQVSHKIDAEHLISTGEWGDPFIVEEQIYLLHKSKGKLRRLQTQDYVDLDGLGHGFEKIRQTAATFKDCAIYYLLDEDIGQLWLLDVKQGSWQKGQSFFDHVLIQESAIVDVLSNGKLYVHGNCVRKDCAQKAHIYCMELIPSKITNPTQKMRWDVMKERLAPVALKTVASPQKGQQQHKNLLLLQQDQKQPEQNRKDELLSSSVEAQISNTELEPETHADDHKQTPKHAPVPARAFGPNFVSNQEPRPIFPQTKKKIPNKLNKQWPPPKPDAASNNEQPRPSQLPEAKPRDIQKHHIKNKEELVKEKTPESKVVLHLPQEKTELEDWQEPAKDERPIPARRKVQELSEELEQTSITKEKEVANEESLNPIKETAQNTASTSSNLATSQIPEVEKWMPKSRRELEKIGEGAFGVVWKCCDDRLRLFVAKQTNLIDEKDIKIAENEVIHLKAVNHKNVIEYYGFVRENHSFFIYMEFMPFGSMRTILDTTGALEESTAVTYIRQILDGLAYIHSILILHSDLKCANLLLDGHGNVKIGDFGIAVQMYLNDKHSFMMTNKVGGGGTLYWMAPEVIQNEYYCKDDTYGRAADMWSLGCTIVEMLTVYPPYFLRYPKELEFLGALGANKLSYNPNEIAPEASMEMSMFLFGLFVIDKTKRIHVGADAKARFQKLFPEEAPKTIS